MKIIHGGDIYRNKINIDFSVNINPFGMPKEIERALYNAVRKCQEYPDIEALKLKNAMSSMLSIPKDYILFGNGASELLMGIIHATRPKNTLIPIPSFYGYEYVADAAKSNIIYFPLKQNDDFLPDKYFLEILKEDINVLFIANPNNPTGKRIDKEYLKELIKLCQEREILVVLDECFIEFCGNEFSMLSEINKYNNLLLVRAITKIYAVPGVRLGYLISSNKFLLEKIRKQLPEWNLSTFAQEAGIACVGQSAYIANTVKYIKEEREFLLENLKKLGLQVFSSEANFILIYSEKPLYEKLLQRGILIRDCENFRGLSKGYYRLAVKQRNDNKKLLKAIGECIGEDRIFTARRN